VDSIFQAFHLSQSRSLSEKPPLPMYFLFAPTDQKPLFLKLCNQAGNRLSFVPPTGYSAGPLIHLNNIKTFDRFPPPGARSNFTSYLSLPIEMNIFSYSWHLLRLRCSYFPCNFESEKPFLYRNSAISVPSQSITFPPPRRRSTPLGFLNLSDFELLNFRRISFSFLQKKFFSRKLVILFRISNFFLLFQRAFFCSLPFTTGAQGFHLPPEAFSLPWSQRNPPAFKLS